jgi:carbamoyltransferase
MATLDAAQRYFELSSGAMADDYNAYRYMILTAKARPEAHGSIPAVIHHDGTGRVQIVRQQTDPFTYAYLKAMGRRVGVEVSVNTSLNVGSPIVQTPQQALSALKRSRGMDGLFLLGAQGEAFLAWHAVTTEPKDGGARLRSWIDAWKQQSGASF